MSKLCLHARGTFGFPSIAIPRQDSSQQLFSPKKNSKLEIDENFETWDELEVCAVCCDGGELLCCDSCPNLYHQQCVGLSRDEIPKGSWYCPSCRKESKTGKVAASVKSEEPSSNRKSHVFDWSSKHVCEWLAMHGFSQFVRRFRREDIDGAALLALDASKLLLLGISTKEERDKFAQCVRECLPLGSMDSQATPMPPHAITELTKLEPEPKSGLLQERADAAEASAVAHSADREMGSEAAAEVIAVEEPEPSRPRRQASSSRTENITDKRKSGRNVGAWSDEEVAQFWAQVERFGGWDKIGWNWELFAQGVPTRVGYQCADYYRKITGTKVRPPRTKKRRAFSGRRDRKRSRLARDKHNAWQDDEDDDSSLESFQEAELDDEQDVEEEEEEEDEDETDDEVDDLSIESSEQPL